MANKFDLDGLKPAETGLLVDGEIGKGEVYGTFADLIVRGYVSVVGTGDERAYNRIAGKEGLNEFETVVIESVFSKKSSAKYSELGTLLENVDSEKFMSGVVINSIKKGVYSVPSNTVLGLVFQYKLFNRKIRPVALALMALSMLLPLYMLLFFATMFSFFVPQLFIALFFMTFAAFPLVGIGMLSGFVLVVWLIANAKKIDKQFAPSAEVVIGGLFLFFFLGHAGLGLMLYYYMKKTASEIGNFDKYITDTGKAQKERYLELREFLKAHPLSKSRLSNEFEAFAIAFDLRPEGTIPS